MAGRASGKTEGELLLNGNSSETATSLRKHQAYVMQDDILLATQTPREILNFSAGLRIRNITPQLREKRVNEIIEKLNIVNCQHTQVGAPGVKRGISGGERKRVSIGQGE